MKQFHLLSLLLAFGLSLSAQNEKISRDQMRTDIDILHSMIEYAHPNPYHSRTEAEIKFFKDSLIRELPYSLPTTTFRRVVDEFLVYYNDAHTGVHLPTWRLSFFDQGGKMLPLKVRITDGQVYLRENFGDLQVGDEITAINHFGIDQVLEMMRPLVPRESDEALDAYIAAHFPDHLWRSTGWGGPYVINYRRAGGKEQDFRTKGIGQAEFEQLRAAQRVSDPLHYEVLNDSVALLKIHHFGDYHRSYYRSAFRNIFKTIHQDQIDHLILDIRNNQYGDVRIAEDLGRYLSDATFQAFSKTYWRVTPELRKNLETNEILNYPLLYESNLHKREIRTTENGELAKVEYRSVRPHNFNKRFTGQVYLITDHHTFAAGSAFAAMFQDHDMGTIIGQSTSNRGSFFADPFTSTLLPNSKVKVRISSSFMVRPNGENTLTTVEPDIALDQQTDPVNYILEQLEAEKQEITDIEGE